MSDANTHQQFKKGIHPQEATRLKQRRRQAKLKDGDPERDAVGLALSGGGIRSATFNLGILQALERFGFLKHVDYLSTVSGGGYIGSCLTWFMSQNKRPFPFGTRISDYDDGGRVLAWLRDHGNYIMPGGALNVWALTGAILAGTLATLAVLVPVFLTVVYWLSHPFPANGFLPPAPDIAWFPRLPAESPRPDGFGWLLIAGLASLTLFFVLALIYAMATSFDFIRSSRTQGFIHGGGGFVLAFGVATAIAGAIPWAHGFLAQHLHGWISEAMSAVSLSGVLSIFAALRGKKKGEDPRGWRSLLLSVGLALAVYGLFLWFYDWVGMRKHFPGWLEIMLYFSAGIAVLANINHVSMHRFYRNRLMEAYMPEGLAGAKLGSADLCRLHEIPQTAAPYHLVCTNVQLTGSGRARLRARGGDSFIFSPLYSGSAATGYVATDKYAGGMNLATAFAISGAAVDPNTYATRSRPLTFLMTLFNVRLGYWINNPRYRLTLGPLSRPRWYWYLLREMFGRGLTEKAMQVHLSDGGHFENLGIYELIRRRCRYIIVCDAGADPTYRFGDLARAIELVRTDFGAAVELNVEEIRPHGEDGISLKAFARGKVYYNDGSEGRILYIKASRIDALPEDVKGYARAHADFPHESTADQFFDEAQFEAYRELGYRIGRRVFEPQARKAVKSLFAD